LEHRLGKPSQKQGRQIEAEGARYQAPRRFDRAVGDGNDEFAQRIAQGGALPDMHKNPETTARVYDHNKVIGRESV
jgi:hypothetical protein